MKGAALPAASLFTLQIDDVEIQIAVMENSREMKPTNFIFMLHFNIVEKRQGDESANRVGP